MTLAKQTNYRFTLKGNKKFKCPKCGKKTLVKYFDTKQSSFLKSDAGRCDRESNCGYWRKLTGKVQEVENYAFDIFKETGNLSDLKSEIVKKKEHPIKYIPQDILENSTHLHHNNGFIAFLKKVIHDRFDDVTKMYKIGTHFTFGSSVIFWYVSITGNTTRGKVMAYEESGKRIKIPYNKTTSMHKVLGYTGYSLDRCFFGEHLLNERPDAPIAIVESEKTAIIASAFIPKYIWLATGGKSYLSDKIVHVLKERSVVLFPDSDAFDDWSEKAQKYGFKVSEIVKNRINAKGVDLADLLIREILRPSDVSPYTVSSRCFIDIHGRHIELIGITDFGRCSDSWHERGKICKACMFNCEHDLKIDGITQKRAFTHREVLDLQQVS